MNSVKILSKRLTLRLIAISDLAHIHELHILPETDEFNALGIPESIEETESIIIPWIEQHQLNPIKKYTFVIEDLINNQFIGLFGMNIGSEKYKIGEIWYKIHVSHWRNGYATEAAQAVINFGFETLKLHRIEAGCAVDNIGSIKVLEKAGMTQEGRKRKILPLKSGWSDNFIFAILEDDSRNITKNTRL